MILGYVRVSTLEQAASDRTSLQEQERVIRGIAMTKGVGAFDLAIYSDPGISGSVPISERPAGRQLLTDVKSGDCVIAAKLDRMFRSAIDALLTAERFKKESIDLILFDMGYETVTGDGMAKCFFSMAAAFAELERSKISDRMREGRHAKKQRSGHIGGIAPYGFRVIGNGRLAKLEEDASEQEILTLARDLLRGARPSYVCEELNRRGLRTRSGREFQVTQIQRMAQGG